MEGRFEGRRNSGGFGGGRRSGGGFGGGRRRFDDGPREMHKAICADCKKECEVPFKPKEDRPVYCKDCYQNHKKF
jgi:CxxC-x17-CxxC domain-containing protein